MKRNKGFTLIEMLVVVGMIGVLAAAVLTALGPSRNKTKDSRIISAVNQVAALIEAKHDGTIFPTIETLVNDSVYKQLKADADVNNGELVGLTSKNTFVVFSKLSSDPAQFYCVDSTGMRRTSPEVVVRTGDDFACK
ncbi:MAG: type II secretion system protein [Candidatus Paceibacterota bacterium]|jgi:prepilin-type N-terminal cleavage/methylation domain-containing protein